MPTAAQLEDEINALKERLAELDARFDSLGGRVLASRWTPAIVIAWTAVCVAIGFVIAAMV